MRDAKKKVRKQTVGKPKEDLGKPVKGKPKPEPKHEGRWVRVDRHTVVFVKDGQDGGRGGGKVQQHRFPQHVRGVR